MRLCTPGCGQCAVVWLQCFCVEARSGKRDLMGYIMLDLRMARTAKPIETVSQSGCACLLLVHLPRPLPTPRLAAGMRCSTLSTKNTNLSYTLQLPWRPHSLTPPPSALLPLFQHVRHLTHVAPWGHSTSRMWLPGVTPPHTRGSLGSLHLTHVAPWGHSTSRMWLPGVTPPHACGSLGSLHLTHVAPWGHSTSRMWLPGVTPPHACGSLGSLHLTTLVHPHTALTHPPTLLHSPPPTPPVSDDPSHLSLVLDEEQGYYILRPQGAGPQDPGQLDIFIVSLMLSGVKDLLQVCEAGVRGEGCGPLHSTPSRWCP